MSSLTDSIEPDQVLKFTGLGLALGLGLRLGNAYWTGTYTFITYTSYREQPGYCYWCYCMLYPVSTALFAG